jgi:ActR/RegA family two-component response regulator
MSVKEASSDQALPLDGARVLVIEDEYYVADDLRRMLSSAGAQVIGPASTLNAAQAALDAGGFDYAVVDLNLHGRSAVPIADRLREKSKSFVIATGYDSSIIPERFDHIPRVEKPFDGAKLLRLLQQLGEAPSG